MKLGNTTAREKARIIAHELGHGVFSLEHPWAKFPKLLESTTDNLMDYGSGTHLYSWQWHQIHNPPPAVPNIFQDSKEGMMQTSSGIKNIGEYIKAAIESRLSSLVEKDYWAEIKSYFSFDDVTEKQVQKQLQDERDVLFTYLNSIKEEKEITLESGYVYDTEVELEEATLDFVIIIANKSDTLVVNKDNLQLRSVPQVLSAEYYREEYADSLPSLDNVYDELYYTFENETVFRILVPLNQGAVLQDYLTEEDGWPDVDVRWVSQFNCNLMDSVFVNEHRCRCVQVGAKPSNNCCNRASRTIVELANGDHSGNRVTIVDTDTTDDCSSTANTNVTTERQYINSELDAGRVVMVGVQIRKIDSKTEEYTKTRCSGNTPASANHYVVIVSRNGDEYRYYEVGRSEANEAAATATTNIFTFENNLFETGKIESNNSSKKYRITDIRHNPTN